MKNHNSKIIFEPGRSIIGDTGILISKIIYIKKTKNKDFIIQTSVSVASVKGTDFWVISDKKIGDSVIGLQGSVSLSNRISGEKIDISAGITGISSTNGSLQSFKSDPKNTPIDLDQSDKEDKKLEIIFKDSAGKKKKLIIDYK